MPRKQKKYHYIYKTTCLITGKFYIGMHSTDNLEDGYLGSGKILRYSVSKHGKDNHLKEIIEFTASREELKIREAEIVNRDLLEQPLNMNLIYGGEGGGFYPEKNKTNGFHAAGGRAANKVRLKYHLSKLKNDQEYKRKFSEAISKTLKNKYLNGYVHPTRGMKRTAESRKRMSEAGSGEKNSHYGTCWINRDGEAIRIKKDRLLNFTVLGYSLGRVPKIEKHKKENVILNEYLRLKPVCRNEKCLKELSFLQFKKKVTSCSKSCSNATRQLKSFAET